MNTPTLYPHEIDYREPMLIAMARLRELLQHRTRNKTKQLITYMTLVTSKRLFLMNEPTRLEALWDTVRDDAALTEFVLDLTLEFRIRCNDLIGTGDFQDWLGNALADCFGCFAVETSVIDQDTLKQMWDESTTERLKCNPWFCVMLLASYCGYDDDLQALATT